MLRRGNLGCFIFLPVRLTNSENVGWLSESQKNLVCRILRWLADEEERLKAACRPKIEFLIIEMSRKYMHFFSSTN